MKIGIDARLWEQTGVGRYIRNLFLELQKIDKKNSYVLFVTKQDKEKVFGKIENDKWKLVIADSRWHSISEQINFPKIIKKEKVDLMHFPYFSVPIFYNKPYVVTIHDLILHHYPSGEASTLPLWLYGFKMLVYRIVINSAARKSKKIIAVSDSTKREIIDHLRVNSNKVEVTYEACDDFSNSSNEKNEIGHYFLYVGNVYPHKNAEKLVRAFKELAQSDEKLKLVFVGKEDYFYKRLRKKVSKLEDERKIIFMFDANDEKLSSLYKHAIGLVRPSLMEGFSLPPLEAMKCECLVIASDISVHREIFSDAIIYFDPKDIYDIVSKLSYALELNSKDKAEFIKKGLEKTREFSWKKTAQETLRIYESSLGV